MLLSEDFRRYAYISDIFVSENYRRRGIAQALLQAIEKEMQKHGCKRIRICTKVSNLSALKCY
jgi:ribosomal protein S18 acetylase RimI-like enzyme